MKYESEINSLFNKIDDDYLIDLICEFSRIKSVWDPKNGFSELEAALWIEQKFKEFGFKTDFHYVFNLLKMNNKKPSLDRHRVVVPVGILVDELGDLAVAVVAVALAEGRQVGWIHPLTLELCDGLDVGLALGAEQVARDVDHELGREVRPVRVLVVRVDQKCFFNLK